MAEKEQYANIRSLIQELETTSYMSEALNDDIAMAAIKVATSKQSKEVCRERGGGEVALTNLKIHVGLTLPHHIGTLPHTQMKHVEKLISLLKMDRNQVCIPP